MKYYFIYRADEQQGPFTFEELTDLEITKETMVWFDGLEYWVSAAQIQELQVLFIAKPPPINLLASPLSSSKLEKHDIEPETEKVAAKNIFGLKRSIFFLILGLLITAFGLYYFNNLQVEHREKLAEESKAIELYQKQQKRIAEQDELLAKQKQIERERIEKEKKQMLERRIKEIDNQLNVSYQNLEFAKINLNNVSAFQFLRTSSERYEQISAAQNKVDLIKDNIRNLQAEMQKINPSWNKGR